VNEKNRDDIAAERMQMIMPLLEENLPYADVVEKKKEIARKYLVSYRTVGRYLEAYQKEGFEGLKPKAGYHRKSDTLPTNFDSVVKEAIVLRRENPSRSVGDLIRILELEGLIKKDSIKRSTLQRHLQEAGYGAKQMRMYTKKGVASRRFAKEHRGMLYQGDIKYGPFLPIGDQGKKKQVYLSAFIDDATRYIVAAKFYENQKAEIVEDTLRTAIMHYGKPDAIYVDNGKQYRSNHLEKACAKLAIKHIKSKPYHPEGKGKIEAFNRRIESFLSEVALEKPKSLEELNEMLQLWIDDYYHKSVHSGLNGISPEAAFKTDSRPLKFVDIDDLRSAFLHTETRKVDKTGCISFNGAKYEAGLTLIGRTVEVYYDATWMDEVEIHHKDFKPFKVKKLEIGPNCGTKRELDPSKQTIDTDRSRLLDGLNEANITGRTRKDVAVVFRSIREGQAHV
jgi:transposase InsO family protein